MKERLADLRSRFRVFRYARELRRTDRPDLARMFPHLANLEAVLAECLHRINYLRNEVERLNREVATQAAMVEENAALHQTVNQLRVDVDNCRNLADVSVAAIEDLQMHAGSERDVR